MRNFRNYYELLGVARDATVEQIKQAYRRLARQYHPDLNPGDKSAEERFKLVGEAYEVLSDTAKRAQYDRFSRYWKQSGFQGGSKPNTGKTWNNRTKSRSAPDDMDFSEFPDFNTFVEQLLGRQPTTNGKSSTATRTASRDSYRPGTTRTAYTVSSRGTRKNAEARLSVPLTRAYLGGRERIRLEDGRSLEVNMPPAMVSGQRIRLKGQGIGGGDLFLKIDVTPTEFFRLEGQDIYCELPVTPSEAVLGVQVELPTLDGPVKMTVPAGVQTGQRLRLANRGYPTPEGDRGDQIVVLQIVVPQSLSPQERALYEQLRQIESWNPRANLPA